MFSCNIYEYSRVEAIRCEEHVLLSGGACTEKASEWRRFSDATPMERSIDLCRLLSGPSACES
jgi:hypothetical protein